MAQTTDSPSMLKYILTCWEVLEEKKAEKLNVLFLGEKSSLTDYLIIATGNSQPHLRALSKAVSNALKEQKVSLMGMDMNTESGWVVVDAYDFMVHIFTEEIRDYYRLESMWKDAKKLDYNSLKNLLEISDPLPCLVS